MAERKPPYGAKRLNRQAAGPRGSPPETYQAKVSPAGLYTIGGDMYKRNCSLTLPQIKCYPRSDEKRNVDS
jgi:hypothetical protein